MTDCEVKEYSNFTAVDDVKLNGKLDLGENTADNGGIRLAYFAFLADAKRKSIDLERKAGRIHAASAILLAFGQNWCGKAPRGDSGCWCRPTAMLQRNSAPTAWCRIFLNLAKRSVAKWASP